MGPNRFLLLRRMSMLPRDLPRETTVTEIATVAIRPARPRAQGIVPGVALHHAGSTGLTHNDVSAGMSDEQDRVVARTPRVAGGRGVGGGAVVRVPQAQKDHPGAVELLVRRPFVDQRGDFCDDGLG